MDVNRCKSIANNIYDKIIAIRLELNRPTQYGEYLNEKLSSIIWDANVLKHEFDLLEKEQTLKEGDKNEDNM